MVHAVRRFREVGTAVAVVLFVSFAALESASQQAPAPGGPSLEQTPLPEPFEMTLKTTRAALPEPFEMTLTVTRPELPDPFEMTLKVRRSDLPDPFEMTLKVRRSALPDPFEMTVKATRRKLPDPFEMTLRATRPGLPDPFEMMLRTTRRELPAPFEMTLKATRSAAAMTRVPAVIGLNLPAAIDRVSRAKLVAQPALGDPAAKREQQPGTVYASDPRASTPIAEGEEVVITVYGPRPLRRVPDVTGRSIADARSILAASDFTPGAPSLGDPAPETAEPGTVATTIPPPETELAVFSPVGIVVFGPRVVPPPPPTVAERNVPDVAGLTPNAARGVLEQHGFIGGDITLGAPATGDAKPGTVSHTAPPAGTSLPRNTAVAMVLHAPRAAAPALPPPPSATVQPPPPEPPAPAVPTRSALPPVGAVPPATEEELAAKWIGRWELTSTTFKVPRADGQMHPVKQQIEVLRQGDKVLASGRSLDTQEVIRAAEPIFTESGMDLRMTSTGGTPIEFHLLQANGQCTGSVKLWFQPRQGTRVGPGQWANWAVTCRRL